MSLERQIFHRSLKVQPHQLTNPNSFFFFPYTSVASLCGNCLNSHNKFSAANSDFQFKSTSELSSENINIKSALVTPVKDTGLKTSEIKILMCHNWQ